MKELNETMYTHFPEIQMIAEESTSWPMVSRPVYIGGLGFGMKWMMGWMHDTLRYFGTDPIYREHHQNDITFSLYYAFTENFMLPLSHDEVVHGKGSLLQRMPGDEWQRFSNLRALYSCMFTHPGTKLLFMGAEIGQYTEWNYKGSIDWQLLEYAPHKGIQELIKALNSLYKKEKALHELDFNAKSFEWIDLSDNKNCVISYLRKAEDQNNFVVVVANLTPIPHENYQMGLPQGGDYEIIFNSDDTQYYGSNYSEIRKYSATNTARNNREFSVVLNLPPLSVIVLKPSKKISKTVTSKKTDKK
jgi:1,4-alpha-glucan branching enzyme